MRDYGKVFTAFWTSEDARGFSDDGRMLALYLMTCQHGNMIGCFRLPNAYAADDLKWDSERVSKGFAELYQKGFAYRCERSSWVVIHRHMKWNKLENPNVGKAAGKLFDSVSPPNDVKALLVKALQEFGQFFPVEKLKAFDTLSIPFPNPIETVSKPVTITIAVTEAITEAVTETITKSALKNRGDEYPHEFEYTWSAYPSRPGSSKKEAFKAWSARLKSGVAVDDIAAGVARYAKYVAALQTEPQYIKQPATFFGPDEHYKTDWTIPKQQSTKQTGVQHGNFGAQDYHAGVAEDGSF